MIFLSLLLQGVLPSVSLRGKRCQRKFLHLHHFFPQFVQMRTKIFSTQGKESDGREQPSITGNRLEMFPVPPDDAQGWFLPMGALPAPEALKGVPESSDTCHVPKNECLALGPCFRPRERAYQMQGTQEGLASPSGERAQAELAGRPGPALGKRETWRA